MKNKTIAILLTFFLGGLGIHKFYLGHNLAGILYLVFSWTFIPALLAILDFISLLLISDQTFNDLYNLNGKSFNSAYLPPKTESMKNLSELKKLYDQGIITAEEYEEKRRKVLDSI